MMKPKMQRNGIQNKYPPLKDICLYMQRFLFELRASLKGVNK